MSMIGSSEYRPLVNLFLTLRSVMLTPGRRVVPRGSTVMLCDTRVSATVLELTSTVVISGKPLKCCTVALSETP